MSSLEKFIALNPTDKRVIRVVKAMNKPLSPSSNIGRTIGELMREAIEQGL